MGLTHKSTGYDTNDSALIIKKATDDDICVAIAGNPNVGKSTIFNSLTGMNQHTGNWPGKTVTNAQGRFSSDRHSYVLIDIPGTYSLMAHSPEEEVARNFLCFGEADSVILVCDATCLERNLNLVLQTLEITSKVVVCINLWDEAKRKHINIDCERLSSLLGVRVVKSVARKKKSLDELIHALDMTVDSPPSPPGEPIIYDRAIEDAIAILLPSVSKKADGKINARWLSLKLLDYDISLQNEISAYFGEDILLDPEIAKAVEKAQSHLKSCGIESDGICESILSSSVKRAHEISGQSVFFEHTDYNKADRKIDKILTGKHTAYPIMFLLLLIVFWLTVSGANYPSDLLASLLFALENKLSMLFDYFNAPEWVCGMLVHGAYRMLAWVVSVMLPPMAIFFPLFTLLEDSGYLPRIAYNLDKPFKKCKSCGKQALTMCMGFGCNAAGVVGCRIIDSKRERLIAMITNSFVPCNGRFPILIAIISMFFIGEGTGFFPSLLSAFILTLIICFGIILTFAVSKFLSATFLSGLPSSFTLELPPYRRPQIGRVIVRSIFDRTLFVLGRAAAVAAPAGMFIWILANIRVGDITLLTKLSEFLDPFASLIGLDGIILLAFILGFPASETIIPIMLMAYMSEGTLVQYESLSALKELLVANGWTYTTAICTMIFTLVHWPCSTTVISIKKESGSLATAAASVLIPTLMGMTICLIISSVSKIFGL